jgi:hypothetical protein
MLETHIVMSSLISRLILILMFCLVLTLVLRHTHLLVLSPFSHEPNHHSYGFGSQEITLCLDTFGMTLVLIVVIIPRLGMVFLLEGFTPTLSPDTWTVHIFPIMVPVPLVQRVRCKRL